MPLTDRTCSLPPGTQAGNGGVGVPTLWGYVWRLFPATTFLAVGAIGCAWAVASKLDAAIEATSLSIMVSIALSVVLVDTAEPLAAPSVMPLYRRRVVPALLGLALATGAWLTARSLAAVFVDAPWSGRWNLLEWLTIAMSQLAIGAITNRRRAEAVTFGPGLVVALSWYVGVAAPRLHQQLFDPIDHPWRWGALALTFAAVALTASLDPTNRRLSGLLP